MRRKGSEAVKMLMESNVKGRKEMKTEKRSRWILL